MVRYPKANNLSQFPKVLWVPTAVCSVHRFRINAPSDDVLMESQFSPAPYHLSCLERTRCGTRLASAAVYLDRFDLVAAVR